MGFEPMPLSRLAPKASALTTRPNLLSVCAYIRCILSLADKKRLQKKKWIQHHTVPGWSPTPVLSGLKPR